MSISKSVLAAALLSALLLTGCAGASSKAGLEAPGTVRRDIVAVLSTQTAAWNRGDVAGFMHGYWESDSLVFIGQKGLTYGYQATLDNYRKNYPSPAAMGQLDFSNLHVSPLAPGAAQVVGRWHLARPAAGDLQGHFLLVLRQIGGQWVIVADHSS